MVSVHSFGKKALDYYGIGQRTYYIYNSHLLLIFLLKLCMAK